MTFRTIRRIVLALFLVALCLATGFVLLVIHPSVQRYGINRLSQEIGYNLKTGNMHLSMSGKPGIHIKDVQVSTMQGKELLTASDIILMPNLSEFFISGARAFFSGSVEAGNLKFQLAGLDTTRDYNLPQVMFQGGYDLNKQLLQIASLKIIYQETSLSATGHAQFSTPSLPFLDISVTSPMMTVETFKSLLPSLLLPGWIQHQLLPAIKHGDIRIDAFSFQGSIKQIEGLNQPENARVLGLTLTLADMVLQPPDKNAPQIRDFSGALKLEDGMFSLDGLCGRFWQSAFQNASIVIPDTYADPVRYLARAEAILALSDMNHLKNQPWFPVDIQQELLEIQEIDGTANISVSIEYETGQAFPKILTSAISLESVKANHPLLRLPLMIEKARIDLESDQTIQFTGSGFWGKTEFQTQGFADSIRGRVSASATTRADIGEMIKLALPHTAIGDWIYGPLVAEGILNEKGVMIDPARIEIGKGYLRFKGRQDYRSQAGMHWISHIHIVQEPAKNLYQIYKPGGKLLDGSLTLEGLLTLTASDGTGSFSGLNGQARLLVENGWISQTNPILTALALISLERIFKPGSPGVKDGRLYFDRIEGEIEIEKGKILVQNLTFQSPAVNAVGTGTIDLNRDHLQLKIGLQPLGTVDSIVSSIPVIGNILTGKEKSLIVYSLEVTGSLSNPRIKNVPLKNISESALGYVERMVFTPERVLKSLMALKDPLPPVSVPDYHAEFDRMTIGP